MDAYDDVEKDIKSGSYNPFRKAYLDDPAFADDCRSLLTLMMSECSREFEQLPILLHAEILRNVLYSGVWSRYTAVTSERLAGKNTHNAADTADGNSTAGRTTNDNPHPDTDNSTTGDQEQRPVSGSNERIKRNQRAYCPVVLLQCDCQFRSRQQCNGPSACQRSAPHGTSQLSIPDVS